MICSSGMRDAEFPPARSSGFLPPGLDPIGLSPAPDME
jgi:hypothetical protein